MSTSLRLCHQDHKVDFMSYSWLPTVTLKLHLDGQKSSKGFKLEYHNSSK